MKYGKWILKSRQISDIPIKLPTECNKCGFSEFNAEKYNYCPQCGRKMECDKNAKT